MKASGTCKVTKNAFGKYIYVGKRPCWRPERGWEDNIKIYVGKRPCWRPEHGWEDNIKIDTERMQEGCGLNLTASG
jgi:hypothetical protein